MYDGVYVSHAGSKDKSRELLVSFRFYASSEIAFRLIGLQNKYSI